MAVAIQKSVWSAAEKARSKHGTEWSIELLLRPRAAAPDIEAIFRAALSDVIGDPGSAASPGDVVAGEWAWVPVPGGLRLSVTECDDFSSTMTALVRALERRGLSGTVSVWRARPGVELPYTAPMLTCRLRVRGERRRQESHAYAWDPDPTALERVLAGAERWCRADPRLTASSLRVGISGAIEIGPDEPFADRLHAAVMRHQSGRAAQVGDSVFRGLEARGYTGEISLVVGGTDVEGGAYASVLDELLVCLKTWADDLAYAYVRPGWLVHEALMAWGTADDWPTRAAPAPAGLGFTGTSFEDLHAPDIFGAQLLGPAYGDRLSEVRGWRVERSSGRFLVTAEDLGPWFSEPFVPAGDLRPESDRAVPRVLAEAREELAALLYRPGVLAAAGYADAETPGVPSD